MASSLEQSWVPAPPWPWPSFSTPGYVPSSSASVGDIQQARVCGASGDPHVVGRCECCGGYLDHGHERWLSLEITDQASYLGVGWPAPDIADADLERAGLVCRSYLGWEVPMRAAVNAAYGPPEVVRVLDVQAPEPAADEVLVRVRASTVNCTDCAYRAARPWFMRASTGLRRPRRTILGTEYAGDVVAVGGRVTAFGLGDRV